MQQVSRRLKNWASILAPDTLAQAERLSRMPFIFPHVALMPDAHLGKGATVGSVIPTRGAIIPAAVGVDIGCGMIAVRTQFGESQFRDLLDADLSLLRRAIEAAIPLSAGTYNSTVLPGAQARVDELEALGDASGFNPDTYAANWRLQLGTLGSGNHFIEVSVDEEDRVWLFLHSGSRGVGNKIAQHHIQVAHDIATKYFIPLEDPDLAYLVEDTEEFERYIVELRWAQRFAALNREEMMTRVLRAVEQCTGSAVVPETTVNCHHNYTTRERHFGQEVWLSRKGAIDAASGVDGLIPGSMGDRSYVVRGRGNALSLNSSPHGAGRLYSRSKARKTFTSDDLEERMRGIEWRHTDAFLDEIPGAYKPIDTVMKDAADLVEVVHELRQIVNVKGE